VWSRCRPGVVARGSAGSVCPKGIDTYGGRFRSIFAIANPDKLDALARPN